MSFEQDFAKSYKPLAKKLESKSAEMRKLILAYVTNPKTTTPQWNKLRSKINAIYADMLKLFKSWSKADLPKGYKGSIRSMMASIAANKKIINAPKKTIKLMLSDKATTPLTGLLIRQADKDFVKGLNEGRKNVIRFTRNTQQLLLSESDIDMALIKGLGTEGNLGKAARVLRGDFLSKMLQSIDGKQFIQAGRYRYTPKYYAELVARTKYHEAQSMATVKVAENYGTDLVKVSSHNTETKICLQYEGKIYSLSGTHKMYPPLPDSPPFHPNCLHNLFPVFESALEIDAEDMGVA